MYFEFYIAVDKEFITDVTQCPRKVRKARKNISLAIGFSPKVRSRDGHYDDTLRRAVYNDEHKSEGSRWFNYFRAASATAPCVA